MHRSSGDTNAVGERVVSGPFLHDSVQGDQVGIIRGRAANQDVVLGVPSNKVAACPTNQQISSAVACKLSSQLPPTSMSLPSPPRSVAAEAAYDAPN